MSKHHTKHHSVKIHHGKTDFKSQPHERKKKKNLVIWIFLIVVGVALYIYFFKEQAAPLFKHALTGFESFISQHPKSYNVYLHLKEHIFGNSYLGVFYVMTFFSLFFVPAPIEAIFAGYLLTSLHPFYLIGISVLGNTLGQLIDYFLGRFTGAQIKKNHNIKVHHVHGHNKHNQKGKRGILGGLALFFVNLLPLPSQIASVGYGYMRYPLNSFIIITILARAIKFIGIFFLFNYARNLLAFVGI